MQFHASVPLFLSMLIGSTFAAPVVVPPPQPQTPNPNPALVPREKLGANGVLTAGEIVEAVAQGLAGTKAAGIVQSVADGLKAGGKSAGGKE